MSDNNICKYGEDRNNSHLKPMDCECILDESLNILNELDELQKITEKKYYEPHEYELYMMGYESAKDKMNYNSGYFKAENKSQFIADFLTQESLEDNS
jgi:hypothetical protein